MQALIDTDPGIDDALALLYAWGSPDLTLAGVTTVAGNVEVHDATLNLFRLIALRRPDPEPPVVEGAAEPLTRRLVTAQGYHGADGLGDLPDWPAVRLALPSIDAADFILETIRLATAPLTLITLGPLTNLAHAITRGHETLHRLARVVVMGGAVDVPGNVTPTAEFNMHVDPEAADRVLDAGLTLDLVPLDATRQAVLSRAALAAALARRPGPVATRIAAFTERAFRVDEARGTAGMILHDPLAVAVALDPTLAQWAPARITIGAEGETRRATGPANCRVAGAVDVVRLLGVFLDRLCPAS